MFFWKKKTKRNVFRQRKKGAVAPIKFDDEPKGSRAGFICESFMYFFSPVNFVLYTQLWHQSLEQPSVYHFLIVTVFLGYPFYSLQLFMGQYTRTHHFKVTKYLCPLMKGSGYTSVLFSVSVCIIYTTYMSSIFNILLNTICGMLPWLKCSLSVIQKCINGTEANRNLIVDDVKHLSAYQYFKSTHDFWVRNVICLFTTWLIICIVLNKSTRTYKKIVRLVIIIQAVLFCLIFLNFICAIRSDVNVNFFRFKIVSFFQVWLKATVRTMIMMNVSTYGNFILAKNFKPRVKIAKTAFILVCLVFLLTVLSSMMTSSAMFLMQGVVLKREDMIWNLRKLEMDMNEVFLFVITPHIIGTQYYAHVLFTFLNMFLFGIIILCNMTSRLHMLKIGIFISFAGARLYKSYVTCAMCLTGFCLAIFISGQHEVVHIFFRNIVPILTMILAAFQVFFFIWIYGLQRMCDDYYFFYHVHPPKYWKFSWFILIFPCIAALIQNFTLSIPYMPNSSVYCLVLYTVPIFLGMAHAFYEHVSTKTLHTILMPSELYGSPDEKERAARKLFLVTDEPQNLDFEQCKHNCILSVKSALNPVKCSWQVLGNSGPKPVHDQDSLLSLNSVQSLSQQMLDRLDNVKVD